MWVEYIGDVQYIGEGGSGGGGGGERRYHEHIGDIFSTSGDVGFIGLIS